MNDMSTGPGPVLISSETEFALNQGWENVETWEGTESACRQKQLSMISGGATRCKLSPKGNGAWQTRGSFPMNNESGGGNTVDTMELETNVVLRHPYQSPIYRKGFSDYNAITRSSARADITIKIIADLVRKYQSGRPFQNDGGGSPARTTNGKYAYLGVDYETQEAALKQEFKVRMNLAGMNLTEKTRAWGMYYNITARDVRGFIEYGTVFKRTVTVGTAQQVQANYVGAGKIWTSAEVIAWEGLPATGGWFTLQPDSQWHKAKPRVVAAYGQKTQMFYSYTEIVTAAAILYEAYNGAVLLLDTYTE